MWVIKEEATYFLNEGGERRVRKVFLGKTTSKQRAEGSARVSAVRTVETQVLKMSYRKKEEQELEQANTGGEETNFTLTSMPRFRERPCTPKLLSDFEQSRDCLIEHRFTW